MSTQTRFLTSRRFSGDCASSLHYISCYHEAFANNLYAGTRWIPRCLGLGRLPLSSFLLWGFTTYRYSVTCFKLTKCNFKWTGQNDILPSSVHDDAILDSKRDEYLYLDAIKFIKKVKSSSAFAETSPMLNDISGVASWEKINTGMLKLYEGEVLKKLPVIQHLLFGSMLPCTWTFTQKQCNEERSFAGRSRDFCASTNIQNPIKATASNTQDPSIKPGSLQTKNSPCV